ncbi:replication protein A 32 kDa subunit A-like isoform X1 [Nicotiana tabacum]|uniref:Replication protein A 32 kDa subunit A-like isoform X1 n=2 Tax=Nicotiana TaxID=4085 RepID=A0AC58UKL6_TOBAC|nr:PREDICTED: replication protein A 32 kDa subunit B-like isoform X1 [Nicotiana sylvestris]
MYGGNSQFDGNAAFAGGGFMPSQATQTAGDHSFSPAKNRDSQTLLPLSVKQISEAFQSSDDKTNFLIDGVDVNNVKVVGILFNKAERVTEVSFVVDDGTGRIDCSRWVNEAVDAKEMEAVTDGMYVRVHGHLKGLLGKRQLVAYSVRPVDDYNEIASHFAEVIYVHSYNSKLRKQQDSSTMSAQVPSSAANTPLKGYQASPSTQFQFPGYNMDGIRGVDKMVLDYLQQPSCLAREKGVHRNELAQQLKVPSEKILEAIESLESEGLVYSTIDEYHYKSTANG